MSQFADSIGRLEDGTPYYAPIGAVVRYGDDWVLCHLCGRWMRIVGGSHLRWHGWTLDAYREAFQLRRSVPTCSPDLSVRLSLAARERLGRKGFGRPPPNNVATSVYHVPKWRSLTSESPQLLSELHPTWNGQLDANSCRRR